MSCTAKEILSVMKSWVGYSEQNGKFKEILNIYNSYKPLARGYTIKTTDEWCDATISAAAIKSNAVDIIGTEVGVEKHVAIFKEKGIWIEDGTIIPEVGDIIVFNWDANAQPNDGYSDHIGIVETVTGNKFTTIEGNMSSAVGRRNVYIGANYIRGFARPKYKEESTTLKKGDKVKINGVFKVDATKVIYDIYQVKENDLVGSGFTWLENGIPEKFIDLTNYKGVKRSDSDKVHAKKGDYFVFNTNFKVTFRAKDSGKYYVKLTANGNEQYDFWVLESKCSKV